MVKMGQVMNQARVTVFSSFQQITLFSNMKHLVFRAYHVGHISWKLKYLFWWILICLPLFRTSGYPSCNFLFIFVWKLKIFIYLSCCKNYPSGFRNLFPFTLLISGVASWLVSQTMKKVCSNAGHTYRMRWCRTPAQAHLVKIYF